MGCGSSKSGVTPRSKVQLAADAGTPKLLRYSPEAAERPAGATPFVKDVAYMGNPQPQRAEETSAAQPPSTITKITSLLVEENGVEAPVSPLLRGEALAASKVRQSKDVCLIIKAMGKYEASAEVQEAGCASLRGLTAKRDGQDPNILTIGAKGGIEAVVRAMGAEEAGAALQENGCASLGNLAANAANQVAIAEQGGVEAVVAAMRAEEFQSIPGLQETGCLALGCLALDSKANAETIAGKGGIEAVLRAMGAHGANARVQARGCLALRNLAEKNAKIASAIASRRGIDAVLGAMGVHGSQPPRREIDN